MLAPLLKAAVSDGIPRRSLVVAAVVGTALNLINQGDALWTGASVMWGKVALTYAVPYCVASYGAAATTLRYRSRREREGA